MSALGVEVPGLRLWTWPRPGRLLAVVGLGLVVLVVVVRSGAPAAEGLPRAAAGGLESLPLPAQALVSRTLGRDDPAYHGRLTGDTVAVSNAGQGLEARFTAGAVEVTAGETRVRLALEAVGVGERLKPVAAAVPQAGRNMIEYRRGGVTEWYVNGPLGLQQGFTLAERPEAGDGLLTLRLTLAGAEASLVDDGRGLVFAGSTLRYRGLLAFDAGGRELPARLQLRAGALLVRVDDRDARYPLTIDPFIQQAKLTASDAAAFDLFGESVSVSGDTVFVGAPGNAAVYVFIEPDTGWADTHEDARLTATDATLFGLAVGVSGETLVVGGSDEDDGAAYVFTEPADGWADSSEPDAKLTVAEPDPFDQFGAAVSISGDTIVAGAPAADPSGAAYVFTEPAEGWADTNEPDAKLAPLDPDVSGSFGKSVSISGDTIVVGAPVDDEEADNAGAAYVFTEPAGGWTDANEDAKLTASDADAAAEFGYAVAIARDTIVVGAPFDDEAADDSGSAYAFTEPADGWADATESAKLSVSDAGASDYFGFAVAISRETVVVGAANDDDGTGAAYVFLQPDEGWTGNVNEDEKLTASGAEMSELFGSAVAISEDRHTIAVGTPGEDIPDEEAGSAYVFVERRTSAVLQWTQDGVPVGAPVPAPRGANDFRAFWRPVGNARLRWTIDGQPVGDVIPSPQNANDVHLRWNRFRGTFVRAHWSRDCELVGVIPVPEGANDARVRVRGPRTFRRALWTQRGEQIGPDIPVPSGANDFRIQLFALGADAPLGSEEEPASAQSCP